MTKGRLGVPRPFIEDEVTFKLTFSHKSMVYPVEATVRLSPDEIKYVEGEYSKVTLDSTIPQSSEETDDVFIETNPNE